MSELMRDRHARDLALRALTRLLAHIDQSAHEFVVIGGLEADILTSSPDIPHMGTTDVDLLLEVGFVFDRDEMDFSWLERALDEAGFKPVKAPISWQWEVVIDGVKVRLDLLCDAPDGGGLEISLPGCRRVCAKDLTGPAPALRDVRYEEVVGESGVTTLVPFSGLGGYLLAKSASVLRRQAEKDPYDFVYVLIHNDAGGPKGAAEAVRAVLAAQNLDEYEGDLRQAVRLMLEDVDSGPDSYARMMIQSGSGEDAEILAQDARTALTMFLRELDRY